MRPCFCGQLGVEVSANGQIRKSLFRQRSYSSAIIRYLTDKRVAFTLKLQSQVSRQVEKKKYHKFWIVIPNEVVERLGWESGYELEHEVKGQTLIVHSMSKNRPNRHADQRVAPGSSKLNDS